MSNENSERRSADVQRAPAPSTKSSLSGPLMCTTGRRILASSSQNPWRLKKRLDPTLSAGGRDRVRRYGGGQRALAPWPASEVSLEPRTLDSGPWTLNPEPCTLSPEPWTLVFPSTQDSVILWLHPASFIASPTGYLLLLLYYSQAQG